MKNIFDACYQVLYQVIDAYKIFYGQRNEQKKEEEEN